MAYSTLLKDPAVRVWVFITIGTRLAVATVPLGSVLFAASAMDSYAIGGLLAGGYAAGEALLAPVMGSMAASLRRGVLPAVLAEGVLLAASVAVIATASGLWWLAVIAMAAAGGVAAGVPGILRAYISRVAGERDRRSGLALDTVINQSCWLAGPAIAAVISVTVTAAAPLLMVAVVLLLTAVLIPALPKAPLTVDADRPTVKSGLLSMLAVPLTASAIIMALMATLDVALPALLESRSAPQVLAGFTLAALAAASIACSAAYGARPWRGSPHRHSEIAVVVMALLLMAAGVVPWIAGSLVLVVLAGVAEAPALLGRSIALTADLPEAQWPVGFSLLYAAGGVGYTIGGVSAGQLIQHWGPMEAYVVVGGAAAALMVAIAAIDARAKP